MTVTKDDFNKIWASTSSVPTYTFSDTDYQNGWEFVGNLPPTRAMWDEIQRKNDEKMQMLYNGASFFVDSVADLRTANASIGEVYATKGYYTANDGGNGFYVIRADNSDTDDGGSTIILDNGNVAELITDGTVNVKQFGAKGDGVTDDTDSMKNAFALSSTQGVFYIPAGTYIVQPLILNATIDHDIVVYGDGASATKLKLKDNSVTADSQPMFMIKNSGFIRVCFHDMYIDMNRTNNHALIDTTGNAYALQHCHAIFCYPQSVKSMSVYVYNVEFYDLIADGVGCGGGASKTYTDVICHNIISKGRQGTRSDICVTGPYDNFIVSDCVLDQLETEANSYTTGHNFVALIENVVTKNIDLDSDWKNTTADTKPKYRIANCVIGNIGAMNGADYILEHCDITLATDVRLSSSEAFFIECDIKLKNFVASASAYGIFHSQSNNTDGGIELHNCSIDLPYKIANNNTGISFEHLPFYYQAGSNATYAKPVVFENCQIKTACMLAYQRTGDTVFKNNLVERIDVDDNPIDRLIAYGAMNADMNGYFYDNVVKSQNLGIVQPPVGNLVYHLNSKGNKTATLGLAINWSRYDKITASRGGSGSIVECVNLDDYQADAEPTTGKWVKGQKVYNTNPSASPLTLGWVCTTSGNAGSAVFTAF